MFISAQTVVNFYDTAQVTIAIHVMVAIYLTSINFCVMSIWLLSTLPISYM